METRTSLYSFMFDKAENKFALNAPTDIVWTPKWEFLTGKTKNICVPLVGDLVKAPQQSYFVEAVRLWSNFADGLVFTDLVPTNFAPLVYLWEGNLPNTALDVPDTFLYNSFLTLNEWIPVNKPLPRATNTIGGAPAGPQCKLIDSTELAVGTVTFATKSIATAFNGDTVRFAFQALISTSVY